MAPAIPVSDADGAALGLAWLTGGGGRGVLRLLREHGAEALWAASVGSLEACGVAPAVARRFAENRRDFSLECAREAVRAAGLRFVPFGAAEYPAEFAHLSLPPAGFFARGGESALRRLLQGPRVTIVGTRRATSYGARAAEGFASAFAASDIAVVSGNAIGVDTRAHKAAVGMGGFTVAILGCGADIVYPRGNRWLYDKILEKGLVISELPPGAQPAPWTFPHRNRLLAALGDAVLVVEASHTSGPRSLQGAALELGRPVFAVPGSIYSEGYRGCNRLLHDGASPAIEPCTAVEDFLVQTRIERGARHVAADRGPVVGRPTQLCLLQNLAPRNEAAWTALADGPSSVDGLVERTRLTARELTAALAELELAGLVERAGPGVYARAP
jgi:DNA processing protein